MYAYAGSNPLLFIDPKGLLFGINAGENFGESAAMYYADITNDPCASTLEKTGAWIGGLFASLWTPGASTDTFLTLLPSAAIGKWLGRPFYQYYTKGTEYTGRWLSRGAGWGPPHKLGSEARRGLNLPPYNKANAVQKYTPKMLEPIRGPRRPKAMPEYGWKNKGTGVEYFRGWGWPK